MYVPYREKQDDKVLHAVAYELPIAIQRKEGRWSMEYTTVLGAGGWYLGVYLPPGYGANRTEPFKVFYLAHGIFGDETDWMVPGNAPNILDNMIARGEIEPTVLVTMGNHFSPGTGFESYNMADVAKNIAEAIIPLWKKTITSNKRKGELMADFPWRDDMAV